MLFAIGDICRENVMSVCCMGEMSSYESWAGSAHWCVSFKGSFIGGVYRSDGGWAGAVHRESFICNVCGSFTRGVCGLVCVLGFGGVSMSDGMYACSVQRVSCVGLGILEDRRIPAPAARSSG